MPAKLKLDPEGLDEICRRHHIRRLSLFGSTLHGTSRPDSDLDLLVEFEPGKAPGLLGLAAIELELAQLFETPKVDLRTSNDLSRHFRAQVLAEAQELCRVPTSNSFRLKPARGLPERL